MSTLDEIRARNDNQMRMGHRFAPGSVIDDRRTLLALLDAQSLELSATKTSYGLLCDRLETAEKELQAVREALRELTDALGMGTPWPLLDVLKTLQDAGEHLLTAHGCDKHGHENTRAAVEQAKALGPRIFAALKQSRGA